MTLDVHHVSQRLIEVKTDDIYSGVLDAKEAKELALHLLQVAQELLSLEE